MEMGLNFVGRKREGPFEHLINNSRLLRDHSMQGDTHRNHSLKSDVYEFL